MIVIAENLNVRNRQYMDALKNKDRAAIAGIAKALRDAGADMINIQCSSDGMGDEDNLPFVTGIITEATGLRVCLDSRNVTAIKDSIGLCKEPPLINYLSATEPSEVDELLEIVSGSRAELVLRASKGTVPITLEAKLQILEDLLEEANGADIPNERLFADPSLVHIGRGMGQDHVVNACEFVRVLRELVEPPVSTIAWISNISTGMPSRLRPLINASFLIYIAGAGLDAAMVDVLDPEMKRAIYLIKSFRDEIIFSPADVS
jgi:cobalamin-dependent methionine synthase I